MMLMNESLCYGAMCMAEGDNGCLCLIFTQVGERPTEQDPIRALHDLLLASSGWSGRVVDWS